MIHTRPDCNYYKILKSQKLGLNGVEQEFEELWAAPGINDYILGGITMMVWFHGEHRIANMNCPCIKCKEYRSNAGSNVGGAGQ